MNAPHPRSKADACSVIWDNAPAGSADPDSADPDSGPASAWGTAAIARFWVALEQNGPWGREAATASHLDPDVGLTLARMCQEAGGRFILIRRPGAHSDAHQGVPQRVYLASGLADRPWLLQADLEDPAQLSQLPWAALNSGDINAVQATLPEFEQSSRPVLMICTNAKRDVCCAVRGRPVALESSAQRPGQVWECSHTGGHRFAPTGVLLPYGQTFARLSPASALSAIDAASAGEVPAELLGPAYDRGRSHLTAPAQAAESFVRQQIQEPNLLALSTTAEPAAGAEGAQGAQGRWHAQVRHVDGRQWDIVAARISGGDDRPESCGKAPVPTWQWSVSETGR